jgi:hypothetical protein
MVEAIPIALHFLSLHNLIAPFFKIIFIYFILELFDKIGNTYNCFLTYGSHSD